MGLGADVQAGVAVTVALMKDRYVSEAALCDEFIESIKQHGGWTVYPETAGFDILCVYDKTGQQLGVEAKQRLNAKVAAQILPESYSGAMDCGPDFRAVLVPSITEANAGIALMLEILGVLVMHPESYEKPAFKAALGSRWKERHQAYEPADDNWYGSPPLCWHDWNPVKRCQLPEYVPQVAAGVPSPLQLSTWKIGALKVIAELEVHGFITAKGVRAQGIDPRRFCAADGYLEPIGDGKWSRGKLPRFEDQHPEAYAEILAKARAARGHVTQ